MKSIRLNPVLLVIVVLRLDLKNLKASQDCEPEVAPRELVDLEGKRIGCQEKAWRDLMYSSDREPFNTWDGGLQNRKVRWDDGWGLPFSEDEEDSPFCVMAERLWFLYALASPPATYLTGPWFGDHAGF